MLRLGGIYIQTGNSQTMSRQEFNRCINIWKKAEAWERKWGWLPMADRIANLTRPPRSLYPRPATGGRPCPVEGVANSPLSSMVVGRRR